MITKVITYIHYLSSFLRIPYHMAISAGHQGMILIALLGAVWVRVCTEVAP
jgi:hypothetical protein